MSETGEKGMTHEAGIEAARRYWAELFDVYDIAFYPREVSESIQAYLSASGMVLVPKVGTVQMHEAWYRARDSIIGGYQTDKSPYEAMIAAAPDPFKNHPTNPS